jgi:adenosylhomocysteine nucleosidase
LLSALRSAGHEALAVEMEGAAVAQVCADYDIPFAAMRTISDRADDTAYIDFTRFVNEVASRYALAIINELLRTLPAG